MRRTGFGIIVGMLVMGAMLFSSANAADPTTFTFWIFTEAQSDIPFFEAAAKSWNVANPDRPIEFEAEHFPYEEMHTRLLLALKSGKGAPDLAGIEVSKFPNFVRPNDTIHLIPLNDIIDPVKDKFVQACFDKYVQNGQYYGVDYAVGATFMYYNRDILAQAGVDVNSIDTWADFVKAGHQVVDKTGKMMFSVESIDTWTMWPIISQRGGDFLDAQGNPTVDDAINVSTLQFLYDLVFTEKIATVAPGGFHFTDQYSEFMNKGGAAAVMMPSWFMPRMVSTMPALKGKMIVRPLPRWEAGGFRSAGMGGTSTTITDQCKNVPLAKEFLAYAKLSSEGNINIWNILGFDPPRWDVWPQLKDQPATPVTEFFGKELFDVLDEVKNEIRPVHYGDLSPKVKDFYRTNIGYHVFELKDQPPEEALKTVGEELRSLKK